MQFQGVSKASRTYGSHLRRAAVPVLVAVSLIAVASISAHAATITMGTTSVGGTTDSGDGNSITCNRYAASASGTVSSLSVNVGAIDTASKNFSLAVYGDTSSNPSTLLGSATGVLTANSWNTLSANVPVVSGSFYWLCYNTSTTKSASNNMRYAAGSTPAIYKAQTYGTWPGSFGTVGGRWTDSYSIYATVTTGGTTTTTSPSTTTSTSTTTTSTTIPTTTTTSTSTTSTTSTSTTSTSTSTTSTTTPGVKPLLVGMGASWTAGAGNTPYTGNASCYRSATNAYPLLAASQLGFFVRNVGCSGADTADVRSTYQGEPAQTSQLAGANWIALNVGANNVDFWGMIESGSTTKYTSVMNGLADMQSGVKKDLVAIHAANPTAKVVVLGYADFIPSTDTVWTSCMGSTIARNKVANLHNAFTQLNANLKAAADAYGDIFVDPTPAFAGHGVCDTGTNRWIFNMSEDFDLHPNASGQLALATAVSDAIRARL